MQANNQHFVNTRETKSPAAAQGRGQITAATLERYLTVEGKNYDGLNTHYKSEFAGPVSPSNVGMAPEVLELHEAKARL